MVKVAWKKLDDDSFLLTFPDHDPPKPIWTSKNLSHTDEPFLPNSDIERIAQRVVDLLKEEKP